MHNEVILIGNLGKDPEVKHLESGSTVGKFSLATNESYKDKNDEWQTVTEWHTIIGWNRIAEQMEKLKKGQLVFVKGKIETRKYQDESGKDRWTTEIKVNKLRLMEKRESNGTGFPEEQKLQTAQESTFEQAAKVIEAGDDLPF